MSALTELLQAIKKSRDVIDDSLRQAGTLEARASLLAESLLGLCPSCRFCACWLHRDRDSFLSVVDEAGRPRPEWVSLLDDKLARNEGLARREQPSKRRPRLPEHVLVVETIQRLGDGRGALALALPAGTEPESSALAQMLLMACSERVALGFQEESCEHLREEVAELAHLANVGEIAGPLAHEFNNFLNVVMLHVTVLQAELPEGLQDDLKEMKSQGKSVAATIKQFQDYKQRRRPKRESVDLNRVVEAVVGALRAPSGQRKDIDVAIDVSTMEQSGEERNPKLVPVHLELATSLPQVVSSAVELKRLCLFLLKNCGGAAIVTGAGIEVRTEGFDHSVQLRVTDSGPPVAPGCLKQMFDPQVRCREGTNSLELAACKAIVRRLRGTIRCENREKQGAAIIVELPLAADVSLA